MNEIERILKLLEEGKISAEEAYKLIEAIERTKKKEEQKEGEVFGIRDVGRIVFEAVKGAFSAFTTFPGSFGYRMRSDAVISEEWSADELRELEIIASGGDLDIKTTDDLMIRATGQGYCAFTGGKVNVTGDFELSIPELHRLSIDLNMGDLDANVKAKELKLTMNAGDCDLDVSSSENVNVNLKMGDLDVRFHSSPKTAIIRCEMGDVQIAIPEDFDGIVELHTSLGSMRVSNAIKEMMKGENPAIRQEDNRYIFRSGEKSKIEAFCKMGSLTITLLRR